MCAASLVGGGCKAGLSAGGNNERNTFEQQISCYSIYIVGAKIYQVTKIEV